MTTRSHRNRMDQHLEPLAIDARVGNASVSHGVQPTLEASLSAADAVALGLIMLKPSAGPATERELEAAWLKPEAARRKAADGDDEEEEEKEESEDDEEEDEEEDEDADDEDEDEDEDDDYLDDDDEDDEDEDDDDFDDDDEDDDDDDEDDDDFGGDDE